MTAEWIDYYNNVRLHSALSYIAPLDQLEGRAVTIFSERDSKLETARAQRSRNRKSAFHGSSEEENAAEVESPALAS